LKLVCSDIDDTFPVGRCSRRAVQVGLLRRCGGEAVVNRRRRWLEPVIAARRADKQRISASVSGNSIECGTSTGSYIAIGRKQEIISRLRAVAAASDERLARGTRQDVVLHDQEASGETTNCGGCQAGIIRNRVIHYCARYPGDSPMPPLFCTMRFCWIRGVPRLRMRCHQPPDLDSA
jgi:hypothetical protein